MVKLLFKPTDTHKAVESKCSKRKEVNLNPFQYNESIEINTSSFSSKNCNDVLHVKDIIGLENCAYFLNDWYSKCNSKSNCNSNSTTTDTHKALLLIGPVGCGKTTLILLVLSQIPESMTQLSLSTYINLLSCSVSMPSDSLVQ